MATISTPNDPNRTATTANAGPQQTQQMSQNTSGAPTSSGKFSTLQKYLGANQGAGQRIAGMVGGNLSQEQQRMKDTTSRELGEAGQANQQFGQLTKDTQGFTQRLTTPVQGPTQTTTGPGYDVSSYQANLSGQQAARDIAADQNQLQQFTGIRTGDLAQQKQQESEKQANEAVQAASKAYDINKQRQSQLQNNQGRDQLLSQILNTKNQRAGVRNLDNAFLTQDKTKSLNTVTDTLRQSVGDLRSSIDSGKMSADEIIKLKEAQDAARGSLVDRLTGMQTEYDEVLNSRMNQVNAAKAARIAAQDKQWQELQAGREVKEKFAEELGLNNVSGSTPIDTDMVSNFMGMPSNKTPYKDVRLFNTIKDQDLNTFLDRSLLQRQASGRADVANQQDIDALNILAQLSGGQNTINKVSDFTGNQTNTMDNKLSNALNERSAKFLTDDLTKTFQGSGYKQEDIRGSSAMARAYSNAAASLNDVLKGDIYRNTQGTQSRGWENTLGNVLGAIKSGGTSLLFNDQARGDMQSDVNNTMEGLIKGGTNILPGMVMGVNPAVSNAVGGYLRGLEGTMRGAGLTDAGGLAGRYIGEGEWGRSMNVAEGQAVGQVKNQADQYLKDINYDSLLKIAKGDY